MVTKTGLTIQERIKRLRKRYAAQKPAKTSIEIPENKIKIPIKMALLVGCDYEGTNSELKGCSKDIVDMDRLLKRENFSNTILVDDTERGIRRNGIPTKSNIMKCFSDMSKSNKYDSFVFHYSGHGYYDRDDNREQIFGNSVDSESDGKDEMLISTDMKPIRDDEINYILCDIKKSKSTVFLLIDACHSGSIADLKYTLVDGVRTVNNANDKTVADIISISGCKDDQTSADAFMNQSYRGAMTASFLHAFNSTKGGEISVEKFVDIMRYWLVGHGFSQIPQLGFTRPYAFRNNMKNYL